MALNRYDSMGFKSEHGIWVRAVDADERIQALQAEITQWRNGSARVNGALLARIEALEAALRKYGYHTEDCDFLMKPCTCGLEQVTSLEQS